MKPIEILRKTYALARKRESLDFLNGTTAAPALYEQLLEDTVKEILAAHECEWAIGKVWCDTSCGRRIERVSYKFCPHCGGKVVVK